MDYPNMSGLLGMLVIRKVATLHELQTVYSYEDALNMAEALAVQNYNEWVAMETRRR